MGTYGWYCVQSPTPLLRKMGSKKKQISYFYFVFGFRDFIFIGPFKFRALKPAMCYVMHVMCEMAWHGIARNGVARLHNIAT